MSLISEHRKSRENHIIVFLHEFRIRYKRKGKAIYGFVEGKEDPSFYRGIIEAKLPSDWKLELWSVGGKDNIFKIHDKLDWRRFNKEQIIFFVDRDLSDILQEKIKNDKNIYITDGYSIENSIVNKDTCARVLIEVCGLHFLSHNDIDVIVSHFCNQLDRFQKLLIPIMSHIISWRKNGIKVNLNAINMKDIFKVCRGFLIKKKYPKRTRHYIQYIYKQCHISKYHKESCEIALLLYKEELYSRYCRGKYLLWFLVEFCLSIYRDYNMLPYVKINKKPKMHLNMSIANAMILVAPRAKCPNSLATFLKETVCNYVSSI